MLTITSVPVFYYTVMPFRLFFLNEDYFFCILSKIVHKRTATDLAKILFDVLTIQMG